MYRLMQNEVWISEDPKTFKCHTQRHILHHWHYDSNDQMINVHQSWLHQASSKKRTVDAQTKHVL